MAVATYKTATAYPKKLNLRESKVIEAARDGLIAAAAASIVNADINAAAEIAVSKLADGSANQIIQTDAAGTGVEWAKIIDANIDTAAAIAITKIALGTANYVLKTNNAGNANEFGQIVNASISNTAEISVSKLADGDANQIVQTAANGTDVEWSKLIDANVDAAAAIARTKLASGSNDHVIINGGAGVLSSEAQLATSRGGTGVNSTATFPASGVVAVASQIFNFYKISVDLSTITQTGATDTKLFGTAIPNGAHVMAVSTQVIAAPHGGTDDTVAVAFGIEDQSNDLFASAAVSGAPYSTTGMKTCTGTEGAALNINTPSTFISCTAARQIIATVTWNGNTAITGTLAIWVHYIV